MSLSISTLIKFILILLTISCQKNDKMRDMRVSNVSQVYSLRSEWKFQTGNIADAASANYDDSRWRYLPVPGFWRDYGLLGNRHAWYRLPILIGTNFADKKLGIIVPGIFEGYELFINGHLIGRDGETNEKGDLVKSTHKINFYSIEPSFIRPGEKNTIALHVLDQYNFGGITGNFYIGKYELVKAKFIFYIIRSVTLNGFFLLLGISLFVATIGKKNLSVFFLFSNILILSGFSILFLDRISGWLITDFRLLHYSFFLPIAITPVLYIYDAAIYFEHKLGFFGKFLVFSFFPILIITILSGINKEFLQFRNSFFMFIVVYDFLTLLYICYMLVHAFIYKKIIGMKYILFGSIIVIISVLKVQIGFFTQQADEELHLSTSSGIFFLFFLYALSLQYQDNLNKKREMELHYREKLEEEIKQKTKSLVKTNEDLKAANKMRDQLFSIIGHDLRSPINALKTVLHLFYDETLTSEQQKSNIQQLTNLLEGSRILLENLLHWASSQLGYSKVSLSEFDLVALSKEVFRLYLYKAKQKSIHLRIVSDETLTLKSDRNIIQMVLNNLVNNAIKFTPTSGKVEIHLIETETHVGISVLDTGIGISVEEKNVYNDNDREIGTGIGLNLCKEFLSKIDSELFYEKNPDGGSIFSFYLKKIV
ncbi:MAG: hypothetical protein H7A23_14430 [Leptospiraceae bacterium]|nr:hypothetical protein [Leptospiraceae bacterium]MCP5495748.1 hypothetical protein [Leptospiraceae bacterium]